jgi:hypothetical protein
MKQKYTNKFALSVELGKAKDASETSERHLLGTKVASCEECNSKNLKAIQKVRIKIEGEPSFCPDCGHALYWERMWKEKRVRA